MQPYRPGDITVIHNIDFLSPFQQNEQTGCSTEILLVFPYKKDPQYNCAWILHDVTLVDITSTDGGHLAELTLESG